MGSDKFSFSTIWGVFMALAYIGISYLILFTPFLMPYNFDGSGDDKYKIIRIVLGAVLFLYGIIRGIRVWKALR